MNKVFQLWLRFLVCGLVIVAIDMLTYFLFGLDKFSLETILILTWVGTWIVTKEEEYDS